MPSKESIQFLGMTLDSRKNWEEHINKLRAKAKRALNTVRVVAGKKWGGDWKSLKNCTVKYVGQRWSMAANYITKLRQED